MKLFADLIEDYLKSAIIVGISIKDFWEMSFYEVSLYIDAYNDMKTNEAKEKASNMYTLAQLIGIANAVYHPMTKKAKMPKIYEIFPSLFTQEEIVQQEWEEEWRRAKENMFKYAESNNRKYKD